MIYQYTIAPIESLLETIFVILIGVSNSYFLSLVLLAILVRLVTKPLEKYVNRAVSAQAEIESVLAPQINAIKIELVAAQRHEAIKRLYARYSYHPVFSIRSLAGLGVQLPFFVAAYFMLSNYSKFEGVEVPILGDLSKPDALLWGHIHLMPLVMSMVNILALLTVPGFSRKNLTQGLVISLMFLILLYASPLALLIYWTTSNLFSLVSNVAPSIKEKLNLGKAKINIRDSFFGRYFEEYAYIFFLTNLAFLIPLLGVLGDQFNFLTAHGLSRRSIIILFFAISIVPTLVLSVFRSLCSGGKFLKVFDGVVLLIFLGLFVLYSLNNVGYGFFSPKYEPYILFCISLLLTFVAVAVILKNQLLRIISYFSLIIPVVFLNFIFVSPASTLFKQSTGVSHSEIKGMNDTPVFFLIFDEFIGTTLQNSAGQLDASRFPGYAELASQSDYFPNALAAHEYTHISVPSIVSGSLRIKDDKGLAPGENLIELFKAKGGVDAYSPVLPADLMSKQNTDHISLISDLITLYIHILSHKNWIEERIGAIPQSWKGFGIFFKEAEQQRNGQELNLYVRPFFDWLERLDKLEKSSQLNLLHIQFPHMPHDTTSLGRSYQNGRIIRPMLQKLQSDHYGADQSLLNVAHHNYLLQSAYTDTLVANFIQTLKQNNLFNKSMIIVTSDHGVSFEKSGSARRIVENKDSWKNIISVPLFIKYPYQKDGVVNSSFVSTLDLSATIIKAVGIENPRGSIGQNLKGIENNSQTKAVELTTGYEKYFKNINPLFKAARLRNKTLFGEGSPVHSIAVNYTENPIYASLLYTKLAESDKELESSLHATWSGSTDPWEVSFLGAIYNGALPVNNKIIAAVIDGEIQAVFESKKIRNQEGFFAFSLPENNTIKNKFNVVLYEIEGKPPFKFKRIKTINQKKELKFEFYQSKKKYHHDLKESVQGSHGLDTLDVRGDRIRLLSLQNNDPFIVFKPISPNKISSPIFNINLKSNRAQIIDLYYQTIHMPKFHESQRIRYVIHKGDNSIFIKVPEDDFFGSFRIDIENTPEVTEVIIKGIELGANVIAAANTNLNKKLKTEFSQRPQRYRYVLEESVLGSQGLDALKVGKNSIKLISSKNKDPFIVLKPISSSEMSEPIFKIKLESTRMQVIDLYYQTSHSQKFDESQRLSYALNKGSNSIYIKIPERDFLGAFRIDMEDVNIPTEMIIQEIELRH